MIYAEERRCWDVGRFNVVVPVVGEALDILVRGLQVWQIGTGQPSDPTPVWHRQVR